MNRWYPILLNVGLYYALWTLAVLGMGTPWWWIAPALVVPCAIYQLRWSPAPRSEAIVIIIGAAAGASFDVLSNALGLFRSASPSRVEFILVFFTLWINFGTTLRPCLRWMWGWPVVAAVFGGIGAPLTYWVAARLGAITPVESHWRAFAWCAVQYAIALPIWMLAASAFIPGSHESTHRATSPASPPTLGRSTS